MGERYYPMTYFSLSSHYKPILNRQEWALIYLLSCLYPADQMAVNFRGFNGTRNSFSYDAMQWAQLSVVLNIGSTIIESLT